MSTGREKRINPPAEKSAGRVVVDSRGRNVWQWDESQLDSTTIMLQSLDNSALALEPTLTVRKPKIDPATGKPVVASSDSVRARLSDDSGSLEIEDTRSLDSGTSFDPYNRS